MKRKRYYCILILLISLMFFCGCASYQPKPLPNLQPEFATYSESIENVTLACKTLTEEDCKKYFDRDIIDKGFQPVQMAIVNDTDQAMLFSPDGVSLPVCRPEEVAEKCHTSTAGRATAYGVAALFLWPFAIPAIVDGVKSHEANKELDKDFNEKNIEQMVINPHTTHNGILFFTNNEYQESFTVRLVNRETKQKLEFYVKDLAGHFTIEDTGALEGQDKPKTAVTYVKLNINEPWTGKWRVEGARNIYGTWTMKQSGQIVKSTRDSYYEIEGKVEGNQLKAKVVGDYNVTNKVVLNISSDGQSFEGTVTSGFNNQTVPIKGIRK